jgi:hypothetical protein
MLTDFRQMTSPLVGSNLFFFFFLFILSFYIYSHMYTLYGPPLPPSEQNLFCPPLLWFCWRENIRDKKDIVFLLVWDKDSYTECYLLSVASMHVCIATHIDSFLPDVFTTSWSPSHSGLCQFKISIFSPLQWAHQPHSSFRFPFLSPSLQCVFSP